MARASCIAGICGMRAGRGWYEPAGGRGRELGGEGGDEPW